MVRCEKCILRDTGLSTRVCIKCGIEKYVLSECTYANCGFTMRHSPFLCGYSRTKRFRGMVEALFWPTPANPDTKMLQYLLLRKFSRRNEILQVCQQHLSRTSVLCLFIYSAVCWIRTTKNPRTGVFSGCWNVWFPNFSTLNLGSNCVSRQSRSLIICF